MKLYDNDIYNYLLSKNTLVEVGFSSGARFFLGQVELPDNRTPFVSIRGLDVTNMLSGTYPKKLKEQYDDDLNKMYEQGEAVIQFSNEVSWVAYSQTIK